MRLLTLVLILAISAQPLQAGFCAVGMDQGQAAAADLSMDMDHDEGHDCCDTESPESADNCEGGSHCGHCTVAPPALPSVLRVAVAWQTAGEFEFSAGVLLPSHSSPPFRPPIS